MIIMNSTTMIFFIDTLLSFFACIFYERNTIFQELGKTGIERIVKKLESFYLAKKRILRVY